LFLHAKASFIDDFRHAVRHVEYGFEKMLGDVVTDMEDTIHCTVAAMEHILIMNGILDKLSDYNRRCPDDYSETNAKESQHETRMESTDFVIRDPNKKYITSQDLHSSIQNVNRTLNDILSRRLKEDTNNGISDMLRNETNRLSEVSTMLRRELQKVFNNVRGELDKIDFEQESPEDVVSDEIKLLEKAEKDGNSTEVDEIRHVVDDAINVLKSDEHINSERTRNNEIDKIIKELENAENESLKDFKASRDREIEKLNNEYESSEENIFTATGKKDLIKHNKGYENQPSEVDEIRHVVDDAINDFKSDKHTDSERRSNNEIDKIVNELENPENGSFKDYKANRDREVENLNNAYQSSEDNIFTKAEKKHNKGYENQPTSYLSPLFIPFSKSNEKETIHEVMDMMKDSQIVNLLFNDDQPGTDLFANPNLFKFF
ncbi:serine protease HtrA-like, partial [Aricia agestis]|uniref:serine protease HtrA-like n=1 Tax=Aricia agestis TaxID=91739 RepID=UPI001C20BF73